MPTVYRLIRALRERDLVVLDELTRQYSLGPGVMRLARVVMNRDNVQAVALRHMELLRQTTEETVGLHWRIGKERVCVAEMESPHQVRMTSGVGRAYPLHAGASGKAFLAWARDVLIDEVLQAAHLESARESAIREELPRIRWQGFATSFGETVSGASALAIPIFGTMGLPVAVLNITGPDTRWTRDKIREHRTEAMGHAAKISQQLGYEALGGPKSPTTVGKK